MQFRQANNKQKQNNNDTNNLALQHYSMTAVRNNTLEETMTKQEVGYGAIEDTNPETQKTPHQITRRTTYGILLFVISFFLVAGAGAGATHSSLRSDTALIVVSSEGFVEENPSIAALEKAADLTQKKADAAAIVATKAASLEAYAKMPAATASRVAINAINAAFDAAAAAENGGEKEKEALAIAINKVDEAKIQDDYWERTLHTDKIASDKANIASANASRAAKVAAAALEAAKCGELLCTEFQTCCAVPILPYFCC